MTTHTGPAPLESPEQAAERLWPTFRRGGVYLVADAIRARDAQWVERLTAIAKRADGTREDHYDAGEAGQLPERMAELKGARDALRDAAKMGGGE